MAEFDDILEDLRKVCEKHGVEVIIKSELSFKKLDGGNDNKETNSEAEESSRGRSKKPSK